MIVALLTAAAFACGCVTGAAYVIWRVAEALPWGEIE